MWTVTQVIEGQQQTATFETAAEALAYIAPP
jgi:hypothetical protein